MKLFFGNVDIALNLDQMPFYFSQYHGQIINFVFFMFYILYWTF